MAFFMLCSLFLIFNSVSFIININLLSNCHPIGQGQSDESEHSLEISILRSNEKFNHHLPKNDQVTDNPRSDQSTHKTVDQLSEKEKNLDTGNINKPQEEIGQRSKIEKSVPNGEESVSDLGQTKGEQSQKEISNEKDSQPTVNNHQSYVEKPNHDKEQESNPDQQTVVQQTTDNHEPPNEESNHETHHPIEESQKSLTEKPFTENTVIEKDKTTEGSDNTASQMSTSSNYKAKDQLPVEATHKLPELVLESTGHSGQSTSPTDDKSQENEQSNQSDESILEQFFEKKYQLASSDKEFEKIMDVFGVPGWKKAMVGRMTPVISLAKSEGLYILTSETKFRTFETKFQIGKEFNDKTFDGREVKSIIKQDKAVLTETQEDINENKNHEKKVTTIIREFTLEEVKITIKVDDIVSIRTYTVLVSKNEKGNKNKEKEDKSK